MEQFDKFEKDIKAVSNNLEMTKSEYEYSILTIALLIIRNYYENSECQSDLETLCSITADAIKQIRRLVEPF